MAAHKFCVMVFTDSAAEPMSVYGPYYSQEEVKRKIERIEKTMKEAGWEHVRTIIRPITVDTRSL
jgi:hypothetical protein